MRLIPITLLAAAAVMFAADQPQTLTGRWKLNLSKSNWGVSTEPAPKALIWNIVDNPRFLEIKEYVMQYDGRQLEADYMYSKGGGDSVNKLNNGTVLHTKLQSQPDGFEWHTHSTTARGVHADEQSSAHLSNGGKTLTVNMDIGGVQGHTARTLVFTKEDVPPQM